MKRNRNEDGSRNILGLYLREAKSFPLLTKEDEKRLFKKIKRNNRKKKKRKLVKTERKIMEANQRLVIEIAKNHQFQGLEIEDLINEGNFGLIKAIERFNLRKRYRFSTYATWWIRWAITRAIYDKTRVIRLPVYMHEEIRILRKVKNKILKEKNREPTFEEIAQEMGISTEKVENLINISKETISFDTPIIDEEEGGESNLNLGNIIPSENTVDPEKKIEEQDFNNSAVKLLSTLTPREEKILRLRFGIGVEKEETYTLEEIGRMKEFRLTRERIRQIQAKALQKLKKAGENPLLE